MKNRLKLDSMLREALGSNNVYFQPPATVKLKYPAIVYDFDTFASSFADGMKYKTHETYSVTLISKDPECPIMDILESLPFCSLSNCFVSENLNHWVFRIHI